MKLHESRIESIKRQLVNCHVQLNFRLNIMHLLKKKNNFILKFHTHFSFKANLTVNFRDPDLSVSSFSVF